MGIFRDKFKRGTCFITAVMGRWPSLENDKLSRRPFELNSVLSEGTQDLKMGEMISMLAEQP